jgi:hypothetical protein
LPAGALRRATALYPVGSVETPNHDAVMRIGGELRGGAPILFPGTKAMGGLRVTPPRMVLGGRSSGRAEMVRSIGRSCSWRRAQVAGWKATPSGMAPRVAKRHSAISNLRASATIIVLRVFGAVFVRA